MDIAKLIRNNNYMKMQIKHCQKVKKPTVMQITIALITILTLPTCFNNVIARPLEHNTIHINPNDTAIQTLNHPQMNRYKDSSTHTLEPIVITAFQGRGDGTDIAASIFSINQAGLQFLDNSSLLSAFNTAPGVRLEQRSPGSLRLSIRGSLLRSPYGVRGIKFYIDDIPLTDAGGNTYLQSISPAQIQSAEIIKGPAGSLYGAGTGGAVLLHTPGRFTDSTLNKYTFSFNGGSYGLINPSGSWNHSSQTSHTYISASHLYSKGMRAQDTSRSTIINYASAYKLSNYLQLNLLGFYSDLQYQTPGGITRKQWKTDTTAYPLAVKQRAGVFNRTFFGGASLKSHINSLVDNETSLLWSHTNFKNPFTSNYEKRKENNYGGRSVFTFQDQNASTHWQLLAGLEWVGGQSKIDNFGNNQGVPDTLQYKDQLTLIRKSFFIQYGMDLDPQNKWHLQAGVSTNQQNLKYRRISDPADAKPETTKTNYLWSPKLGLTYQLLPGIAIYGTAAKGFSTPTLAEIHPSDGRFEQNLQAESGWNLEGGLKGHLLNNQLYFEGSLYRFNLKNAIVRRADENNIEYYVNAGSTSQKGAELWISYHLFPENRSKHWISQVVLQGSYSYQPYHFTDYQVEDNNYNGHPLTGVPKNVAVFSINLQTKSGLYLHSLLNATSSIPLNDASLVYAKGYQLWQAKLGYQFRVRQFDTDIYFGLDNILNQRYSLGNDINAYGGRYFNPAPGRNCYAGIQVAF